MRKISLIFIFLLVGACNSLGTVKQFGAGVDITFDPRTVGMQIDDTIMQKNLSARLALLDKKYFLLANANLADKFFCMIVSSICIPIVLGSKVMSTPAPNLPNEEQEVTESIIIMLIIFFIFNL